jgi:hypothetical protein
VDTAAVGRQFGASLSASSFMTVASYDDRLHVMIGLVGMSTEARLLLLAAHDPRYVLHAREGVAIHEGLTNNSAVYRACCERRAL